MDRILTNSQMRAADAYTINGGVSSESLMHRAGIAVAEEVIKALPSDGTEILVVCGTGNNGGDGYVCAEELAKRNLKVKVFAFDGRLSEDCAREKSRYTGGYSDEICGDVIVDCIFGTGLSREVTGGYAEVIGKINSCGAFVISADIPSGVNGDNGKVLGCAVRADETVAVAEYKTGMFLGDGLDYCGTLCKKNIGIACPEDGYAVVYGDDDVRRFFPLRKRNSHKGTYGSANLIAGSGKYIGAAALAAEAALKSGCGYVRLTTDDTVKLALAARFSQVIFCGADMNSQSIALGMGCGISEELYRTIVGLLENYEGTLIIDADGLNTLARFGKAALLNKRSKVILTPHVKEFSRLTGLSVEEILNDPVRYARAFAEKYGVTVLLKGAASVITDGSRTALNIRGSTALSKGGSGDMLSGYMCGCAARGLAPFDAAVCAAYTLGLSAEISSEQKTDYCATAKDILKNLHFAVRRLTI